MPVKHLTEAQVGDALKRFGHYRVTRTQIVANAGAPDGISGATLMALGLRETGLRNINGGARWDPDTDRWVATKDDKGVFQISAAWNSTALRRMLGVAEGTWGPTVVGKSPMDPGFCPRFEESLQFALNELHETRAYAEDKDIEGDEAQRFSIAAYNAGMGGAMAGYLAGDVDKYTAMGDYSEWVLAHRKPINAWLRAHPNWQVKP